MVQRTNKHVKIIYIKFGELVLKGKNRWDFTNCLLKNIKTSLQTFKKLEIKCQYDCIIISNFSNRKYQQIIDILKLVPGIGLIIEAYLLVIFLFLNWFVLFSNLFPSFFKNKFLWTLYTLQILILVILYLVLIFLKFNFCFVIL